MIFLPPLLLSLFITIGLIPILKTAAIRANVVDLPDPRKVHTRPVPRIGGVAVAFGVIIPVLFWGSRVSPVPAILSGASLLVLAGFLDDKWHLGYRTKFAAQIVAALIAVFGGDILITDTGACLPAGWVIPNCLAVPLTVFVIVGVTNAINLVDGLDGLAGGVAMLTFICIAGVGGQIGSTIIPLISICVIGAIIGFLRFNTHPAIIFMGDAGSQLLGFLAITLSLLLIQECAGLNRLFWLVLIGFPILDTLTVMSERIADGRSPFLADKNHFHHKLMRLGLYHSEAVTVIYLIQVLFTAFAYVFRFYSEWVILTGYVLFSGAIIAGFIRANRIEYRFRHSPEGVGRPKGAFTDSVNREMMSHCCSLGAEFGALGLFIISALIPARVPLYFSLLCWGMIAGMLIIRLAFPKQRVRMLRTAVFLTVPLLLFLTHTAFQDGELSGLRSLYDISFSVLALVVVTALRLNREPNGFKATPTDYLILFVALVVPNLPGIAGAMDHLNLLAAKIIVLIFSFEVVIGGLNDSKNRFSFMTMGALFIIGIKGWV